MKLKAILFLVAVGFSTVAFSQETKKAGPPAGKALIGDVYGGGISNKAEKKAMTTSQVIKQLDKDKELKDIAVKAKVVDVCDKKGCWLTLETADKSRFFVKMQDYAFFVPTALKGKEVVLEGTAKSKEVSIDELKHYAEDAKKPQAEIDAITQPGMETRFIATGIKVVQ